MTRERSQTRRRKTAKRLPSEAKPHIQYVMDPNMRDSSVAIGRWVSNTDAT